MGGLLQAGSGLMEGDGIKGMLSELTHESGEVYIQYEEEEIIYSKPDITLTVSGLIIGGLDTVHGCVARLISLMNSV